MLYECLECIHPLPKRLHRVNELSVRVEQDSHGFSDAQQRVIFEASVMGFFMEPTAITCTRSHRRSHTASTERSDLTLQGSTACIAAG